MGEFRVCSLENKVNADGTVDRATLPWRNGAQTLLPPTFRYDIKKRDGWKMVCHTFAGRGFDEGNYMVFYNQLTGYFKVFYYFEGDNNLSGAQWYIETLEGQKAKMFEMTEYLSKTLKDAGKNDILLLSNAIKSPVGSFSRGWNGFEFLVPYSQDYLGKDFYICAYGTLIGQFNIVGKEIIESVTTTSSTTTQVGSTIETVYTMEDSQADSYVSNLGDYAELGGEVATAVASAGQNGTASALSSGADKAFSSTTTVTTTSSSSVSNQKVKVSATGTITLEGKLVFETGTAISPLPINMYDVLNASANSTNSSLVYSPASTTGHNLGLWTLADIPEVSYSRVIRLSSYQATPAYPGATDQFMIRGTVSTPTVHGATPEVVFNPDVEPYITKKIISAEYMLCDKLEGEKYKEDVKDYLTIGESNLLYSDEDKAFYNVTPQQVTVPGPATMVRLHNPAGRGAFFFDWGEIEDARILAVVKVDVTFNYEGEEKHLVQTRVYPTRSIVDPQNEILLERYHIPENDSYVLNYGNPYYK